MIITKPRMNLHLSQSTSRMADSPIALPYRGGIIPMTEEVAGKPFPRLKFPIRIASVIFSLAVWWLAIKGAVQLWNLVAL